MRHPIPSRLPRFLSVLIFDVYSVHHCSNRFPPSFESTWSTVPSVTRLYAPTSKLLPVFISIALPHCFALSFSSFSTPLYMYTPLPVISPSIVDFLALIGIRFTFETFSSCFHVLHKFHSVTLPLPPSLPPSSRNVCSILKACFPCSPCNRASLISKADTCTYARAGKFNHVSRVANVFSKMKSI